MVPPYSHRVSRVRRYSGYSQRSLAFVYRTLTFFGLLSHTIQLALLLHITVLTPRIFLLSVWPPPRSLATTCGISVDFFSSPYLDVSVQAVPFITLWIHAMIVGLEPNEVSPFGYLRIKVHLQLPVAFRSLSRPSSAPCAKAFTLCSSSLELSFCPVLSF